MYFSKLFVHFPLAVLAVPAMAQLLDPIFNMSTRWHHQSIVKDDTLYIDGGVEIFYYDGAQILGYNQYLLEINMSTSWDWKTNISMQKLEISDDAATGTRPPSLTRGAAYQGLQNDSKLYTYGGTSFMANRSFPDWAAPDASTYSLWSYDTVTQSWSQYDVTMASPYRPNRGAFAEATNLGLAFFLNGQIDHGTSSSTGMMGNRTDYLEGLIVIDTYTQTAKNISTDSLGEPRVAGGLQYIESIGVNGILVALGGMRSSGSDNNNMTNGILIDFTNISLSDSFASESDATWYSQPTTGDIPAARTDFCVVTASALDNSSHNIYLYGGYDPVQSIMYDDVYALSLPSFTWTTLYAHGESPRYGHTCHVVGKRQMLTVGGSLNSSAYGIETTATILDTNAITADWELRGVAIYDMSTLVWGSVYNADDENYLVPDHIVSGIGGAGIGGATMTAPAGGFADAGISTMFGSRATATTTNTAAPSVTSAPSPRSSHKVNIGAVVGGVVGGTVGLALFIGCVVWPCFRSYYTNWRRGGDFKL